MDAVNTKQIKISFVGDSGVGKTSIINRKVKGSYVANTQSTIGSSHQIATDEVDGEEVKMALWDTAGQEKYESLVPLYVRDSQVICVVASYDDEQSIANIKKWIDTVHQQCDTADLVIIINKIDKAPDILGVMQEMQEKDVNYENQFYVSAKDGSNIDSLFYSIAKLGKSRICLPKQSKEINLEQGNQKKSGCC